MAGHDNSLFRLAESLQGPPTTEDSFVELRPKLELGVGALQDGNLQLDYEGVWRRYRNPGNSWAQGHSGAGLFTFDKGRTFGVKGALSAATELPAKVDDAGYLAAAATAGTVFHATERLDLGIELVGQWLDSAVIHDWFGGASVEGAWRSRALALGAKLQGLSDFGGWGQLSLRLSTALALDPVLLSAELGGAWVQDGYWTTGGGGVQVRISDAWSLAARYFGRYESYASIATGIVAHNLGLVLHYAWESRRAPPLDALVATPAQPPGPAAPGTLVLELTVPEDKTRVALIGDLNGWDETQTPFDRVAPGVWQLRLTLLPGRYAYQLVVDGERCLPQGATAYRPDDFGGENAELAVTAAGAELSLTCPR
ncbi:MAG: hypothetical protein HY903_13510 [Deltaproteobacteria bacterium]|nr:hypothetical protein [Deltaproteobacteria bacterium]